MKTTCFFMTIMTVLFLFAGCAKDEMFNDNMNTPELKKAKVPVPMKVDLCASPDMNSELILSPIPGLDPNDPASYIVRKWIIGGNGTHLGKLNSEKSFYDVATFEFIIEDDNPYLIQTGNGFWVAANGDNINYEWRAKATLDLHYTGEIEFQSGTGKFEGCSGTLYMVGSFDPVTFINCFTAEGYMEFN